MFQHQITAVHESAHAEEKQRQDQADPERSRQPSNCFTTHSPTIVDREGKREYTPIYTPISSL